MNEYFQLSSCEHTSVHMNEYLFVRAWSVAVFERKAIIDLAPQVRLSLSTGSVRSWSASMLQIRNVKFGGKVALISGKCLISVLWNPTQIRESYKSWKNTVWTHCTVRWFAPRSVRGLSAGYPSSCTWHVPLSAAELIHSVRRHSETVANRQWRLKSLALSFRQFKTRRDHSSILDRAKPKNQYFAQTHLPKTTPSADPKHTRRRLPPPSLPQMCERVPVNIYKYLYLSFQSFFW